MQCISFSLSFSALFFLFFNEFLPCILAHVLRCAHTTVLSSYIFCLNISAWLCWTRLNEWKFTVSLTRKQNIILFQAHSRIDSFFHCNNYTLCLSCCVGSSFSFIFRKNGGANVHFPRNWPCGRFRSQRLARHAFNRYSLRPPNVPYWQFLCASMYFAYICSNLEFDHRPDIQWDIQCVIRFELSKSLFVRVSWSVLQFWQRLHAERRLLWLKGWFPLRRMWCWWIYMKKCCMFILIAMRK